MDVEKLKFVESISGALASITRQSRSRRPPPSVAHRMLRRTMKTSRPEITLAVSAAVASVIALAPWLYMFWTSPISKERSEWANFGTFVGGVLSPALAFMALIGLVITIKEQRQVAERQKEVTDNESYFRHAVASLERAYQALCEPATPPRPLQDRMAWLSSARLLLSASGSARQITAHSSGLRHLYQGEEAHWRHRFYQLLEPTSPRGVGASTSYFEADRTAGRSEIEERSIRVIYDFCSWPDGQQDPIDEISRYTRTELDRMNVSMHGIRQRVLASARFREPRGDV